jgi:hypothetical protein
MRILKVAGVFVAVLWAGGITWMVADANYNARQACFYAAAAAFHENPPRIGGECPIYR